ncbi:hypothetical protein TNCV_2164911 [Trichonephila clavipes]|nr:hypothetical protein TNCV_2164911 [Trichonephila clavipes]
MQIAIPGRHIDNRKYARVKAFVVTKPNKRLEFRQVQRRWRSGVGTDMHSVHFADYHGEATRLVDKLALHDTFWAFRFAAALSTATIITENLPQPTSCQHHDRDHIMTRFSTSSPSSSVRFLAPG